ncbi:MAG: carboxypeptidase regulatory-like domain-containing protein [Gemmatimonadota bacterium]
MSRALVLAIAALLPARTALTAQGASVVPRVRGVAFDSLRNKPLADAFIAIAGGSWSTTSDSLGRFELEKVPAGVHSIILQHSTLDTLGFSGLTTRVRITDGVDEVRLGVPSFETLWQKACNGPVPLDSGFVYGMVYNATTNKPIADAEISLVWHDSIGGRRSTPLQEAARATALEERERAKKTLVPKGSIYFTPVEKPNYGREEVQQASGHAVHWRVQARTDSTGTYAVCGVPMKGLGIQIMAATDSLNVSDSIDVRMDIPVHRRDLRIAPTTASGSKRWGIVTGQLTDFAGAPFPYARVIIAGAPEARSDELGRFIIREVAAGTRRVDFLSIGLPPTHATVDVVAGDTAALSLVLGKAQTLGGVNVKAMAIGRVMAIEFESRRKIGLGYVADSTEVSKYNSVTNVLRNVPSLIVTQRGGSTTTTVSDDRGGQCTPIVWLDGVEAGYGNLTDLTTNEVAGLEVYTRGMNVPTLYREKGVERKCGAILVWTKYLFKNR